MCACVWGGGLLHVSVCVCVEETCSMCACVWGGDLLHVSVCVCVCVCTGASLSQGADQQK